MQCLLIEGVRQNVTIHPYAVTRPPLRPAASVAGSTALRPLRGDYSSPARETAANIYALKEQISFKFTTTLKL